ncbi:MAG: hypothetical protein OQK24_03735 [Magnetovibrio sp.]|nr:hypothetical protein [Magnetovibrio sp.]
MSDTETAQPTPEKKSNPDKEVLHGDHEALMRAKRIMSFTGYIMLIGSLGLLVILAYQYLKRDYIKSPGDGQDAWNWFLQNFTGDILIFLSAVFLSFIGIRLLGAVGKGTVTVIPSDDRELLEPLISEPNEKAIKQYVVLSSLSGFTGTFQKIGFSGLPLAMVTLTLVFSILSFFNWEFMELAKLTLGAFIGSFVQKSAEATKLP